MSFRERMEEEDRNQQFEDERRREREREHTPAPSSLEELAQRHPILAAVADAHAMGELKSIGSAPITTDPTLLMILRPRNGTEGVVVKQAMRAAEVDSMTLMVWGDGPRPRLRIRLALRLLLGRDWRRV